MSDYPSIKCPHCGRVSYHPKDIEHRYCAVCGFHDEWNKMSRKPAAWRNIICLAANDKEYSGLYYDPRKKGIYEPITGKEAEPVIGPIKGWKYPTE